MTNKDYTHLVIISDRSGSMQTRELPEFENGINNLINEQKEADGKCTITLCEFDNKVEYIHEFSDISSVSRYSIRPRSTTALYRAIGETFEKVGNKLASMDEKDRPGLVLVLISTDGYENASGPSWTASLISQMIKKQENIYNWSITFLGSGINAEEESHTFGLNPKSAVSFDKQNASKMYTNVSDKIKRARKSSASGASAQQCRMVMDFSDDEKSEINK